MFGSQALAFAKKIFKHISVNIRSAAVVRIRKGASCHALQAQVVPLPMLAPQTDRYVPQAFQASGLRVKKHDKLLPAAKTLGVFITSVSVNALLETMTRYKLQNLAKYCISYHWANLRFLIRFALEHFKSNKKWA